MKPALESMFASMEMSWLLTSVIPTVMEQQAAHTLNSWTICLNFGSTRLSLTQLMMLVCLNTIGMKLLDRILVLISSSFEHQ